MGSVEFTTHLLGVWLCLRIVRLATRSLRHMQYMGRLQVFIRRNLFGVVGGFGPFSHFSELLAKMKLLAPESRPIFGEVLCFLKRRFPYWESFLYWNQEKNGKSGPITAQKNANFPDFWPNLRQFPFSQQPWALGTILFLCRREIAVATAAVISGEFLHAFCFEFILPGPAFSQETNFLPGLAVMDFENPIIIAADFQFHNMVGSGLVDNLFLLLLFLSGNLEMTILVRFTAAGD